VIPGLIVLFALYVAVTAWQMRRAVATHDPEAKLAEAKRLLFTSALGVPRSSSPSEGGHLDRTPVDALRGRFGY
jgi:hypothetical protein